MFAWWEGQREMKDAWNCATTECGGPCVKDTPRQKQAQLCADNLDSLELVSLTESGFTGM